MTEREILELASAALKDAGAAWLRAALLIEKSVHCKNSVYRYRTQASLIGRERDYLDDVLFHLDRGEPSDLATASASSVPSELEDC